MVISFIFWPNSLTIFHAWNCACRMRYKAQFSHSLSPLSSSLPPCMLTTDLTISAIYFFNVSLVICTSTYVCGGAHEHVCRHTHMHTLQVSLIIDLFFMWETNRQITTALCCQQTMCLLEFQFRNLLKHTVFLFPSYPLQEDVNVYWNSKLTVPERAEGFH